jgi:hypothetical protein
VATPRFLSRLTYCVESEILHHEQHAAFVNKSVKFKIFPMVYKREEGDGREVVAHALSSLINHQIGLTPVPNTRWNSW